MKKSIILLAIPLFFLKTNTISAQCATNPCSDLTGLSATVAADKSISPGTDNTLNLGSASKEWKNIYLGSSQYFTVPSIGSGTAQKLLYINSIPFMHNTGGGTGTENEGTFLGLNAGQNTTTANNGCVGIGYDALNSMTTGNHNTAIGWRSLLNMTGSGSGQGDKNTMIGSRAGESISTGSENTGVGWNVFYKGTDDGVVSGSYNVGIGGGYVLKTLSIGNYNTVIGHGSGTTITSGNNNIIVGATQEPNLTSYGLNIGGTIYGDLANDKISIGNSGTISSSMFNVGSSDQFQINSSGKIRQYAAASPANGMLLIGNTSTSVFETGTLTGGSGINTTNGSGTITLDMDINELTAETNIAVADDYLPFYDASESANNKMTVETLLAQYITSYRKNRFDYYNEFINGIATSTGGNDIIANNNGSGAGSSSTSASSATNIVGLVRSQTGTDADGRTSCATYNSAVVIGGGEWMYEVKLNQIAALSDASSGAEIYQLLIGFYDVNSAQNQTDGIYFLYDRAGVSTGSAASANWQTVTSSNATRTFTTTSTSVSTSATTLKIIINAAGTNAEFFINGTSVGTQTTNIPTGTSRATGFGWMLIKSTGTTNRALEMDYLSVQCDYTTPKS